MRGAFFLATNLEEISGLMAAGLVCDALVARGGAALTKTAPPGVRVIERETGRRSETISVLVGKDRALLHRAIKPGRFIWTFRPYPWTDDIPLLGARKLVWDHPHYLAWTSKLHQTRLLMEHGDEVLRAAIDEKIKTLDLRYVSFAEGPPDTLEPRLYFKDQSHGGQGVYAAPDVFLNATREALCRSELRFDPHIPVSQVAFVVKGQSLCYPPSVMIIAKNQDVLDYRGSDFTAVNEFLSEFVIKRITAITSAVGRALSRAGYQGVFNCDYLVDGDTVLFGEVNVRNSGCSFMIERWLADDGSCEEEGLSRSPTYCAFFAAIHGQMPEAALPILDQVWWTPDQQTDLGAFVFHRAPPPPHLSDHPDAPPAQSDLSGSDLTMIQIEAGRVVRTPQAPTRLAPAFS
jgi:hypothetical protein